MRNTSVQNLLPLHVAEFYLKAERGVEDLFAEKRNNAGVLFASIPNFTEFYSEDVNEGVECIRLLNEIIIDFDEILDDEKFGSVEKIKTVGSTYMAASGITPSSDKVSYVTTVQGVNRGCTVGVQGVYRGCQVFSRQV